MHSPGVWEVPVWDPPVVHISKQSPQLVGHHDFAGSSGSIIMGLPAAVNFVFHLSLGFGASPHPQDPDELVNPLYLVVEAHGCPGGLGGQPSHFDMAGVAKLLQGEPEPLMESQGN